MSAIQPNIYRMARIWDEAKAEDVRRDLVKTWEKMRRMKYGYEKENGRMKECKGNKMGELHGRPTL